MGADFSLPEELLAEATLLSGELAWGANRIFEVIEYLGTHELAVAGIELFRKVDGHPVWIASSSYNCPHDTGWKDFVACCAEGAAEFVRRFQHEPGALFDPGWTYQGEIWK